MMKTIPERLVEIETNLAPWMAVGGLKTLRFSLALIYLWFGLAKLFSPADGLELVRGLMATTGLPGSTGMVLAVWEIAIGILFLRTQWTRYASLNAIVHLLGTFLPFLFLPALTVYEAPWLTLHGQFIIKNVTLLGAAVVVWAATVRRREG